MGLDRRLGASISATTCLVGEGNDIMTIRLMTALKWAVVEYDFTNEMRRLGCGCGSKKLLLEIEIRRVRRLSVQHQNENGSDFV